MKSSESAPFRGRDHSALCWANDSRSRNASGHRPRHRGEGPIGLRPRRPRSVATGWVPSRSTGRPPQRVPSPRTWSQDNRKAHQRTGAAVAHSAHRLECGPGIHEHLGLGAVVGGAPDGGGSGRCVDGPLGAARVRLSGLLIDGDARVNRCADQVVSRTPLPHRMQPAWTRGPVETQGHWQGDQPHRPSHPVPPRPSRGQAPHRRPSPG